MTTEGSSSRAVDSIRDVATSVRPATSADASTIASIYAEGIRSGTATVVSHPPTAEAVRQRLVSAHSQHAWVVAERDREVVGWAATMPYLPVPEYAGVAEFSVYVSARHRGSGAGRLLMTTLLTASTASGIHKLTSRVFAENRASRSMLAGVGFREVGTYVRHVRMQGEWRDVVVVEALLGDARTQAT